VIEIKILHICQYYNDGWGYQENLLPRYQAKLGHKVVVITSDRRPYYMGDGNPRIIGTGTFDDNGIRVERLPIKWEFRNRFVVFKDLMNALEREKPDYIFHHGLTMPSLIVASKYKRKHLNTFLATDNHADLNISARNILWRNFYYRWFWRLKLSPLINNVDIIFGVTPARCYFPVHLLGVPLEKVRLLPIGADIDEVKKIHLNREVIRDEFNIPKDDLIVIAGGKLNSKKGINRLIDALHNIEHQNIKLVLFGSLTDELKEKVSKSNKIIFVGWLNRQNTLKVLYSSDLAIWPGIHTTLIEDAIAVGTPILLRYHGSTSHHIRGNGLYLFKGDVLEIYQSLKMLFDNKEVLEKMRINAIKQRDVLSYDQIAKESIEYYFDLSPKEIHKHFMNSFFCDPQQIDFENRIV